MATSAIRAGRAGAPLTVALARLSSPAGYLGVFGSLQLALLWLLKDHFGVVIPAAGTILLVGLFLLLRLPERWASKTLLLATLIAVTTLGPAALSILERPRVGLTTEHDGLVQVEAAIDRLIAGQPIYGVDWSGTDVARMPWTLTPGPNPALAHFAYPPLTVLVGIPFRLATGALGLPFDYRLVLMTFVILGLRAVLGLPLPAGPRFMVAIALYLNPLISLYFYSGRNDLAYLSMLLLGLALLGRGRPILASAAVGTAVALKPFGAFGIPFILAAVSARGRTGPAAARELAGSAVALAAVPALTIGPFFLKDPGAFWRDTVLYTSGGIDGAYPIGGYGLGALLLVFHVVARNTDRFSFGIFELAAAIPATWLGVRHVLRRPSLGRWMAAYVGLYTAFLFFSRFFNDNYAGVAIALLACVYPLGDTPLARAPAASSSADRWR